MECCLCVSAYVLWKRQNDHLAAAFGVSFVISFCGMLSHLDEASPSMPLSNARS